MSIRTDLIESIRLLFTVSSLGISSSEYVVRRVRPQDLDFDLFPLAHVLAPLENQQYMIDREIEGQLTPEVRVFFNDPTPTEIEDLISAVKVIVSTWSPPGANWVRLIAVYIRSDLLDKYVEVAFQFTINYWRADNQP